MAWFKHSSAYVDEPSSIGDGTKIWHFTHIMNNAVIGKNCVFGQNCHVASGVIIGNNVRVQNNVSIYSGVIIEDDVFLGPSCVFTNIVNPRAQISRRGQFAQTLLKRGSTVCANATVICGSTIGRYAFIAAGAVTTRNVPDYGLVAGVPGVLKGWISRHGYLLPDPDENGIMTCANSGYRYKKTQEGHVQCLDLHEDLPLTETS
jgi:UDP-2-acetamido-3-amino-2,3-dideoxy-glucuronate N-acetyltransferase